MQIDLNIVAAIASGIVTVFGLGKYAVPAVRKLGQVGQLMSDADQDVQASARVVSDLNIVMQGAQNGTITAVALQSVVTDAQAAAAAFAKTVSDAKALVS